MSSTKARLISGVLLPLPLVAEFAFGYEFGLTFGNIALGAPDADLALEEFRGQGAAVGFGDVKFVGLPQGCARAFEGADQDRDEFVGPGALDATRVEGIADLAIQGSEHGIGEGLCPGPIRRQSSRPRRFRAG